MIQEYFYCKKWGLWAYGGAVILFISLLIQVRLSVAINVWYGDFYTLLQFATERDVSEFWDGILTFIKIAIPYVIIASLTNWFTRMYALRWREALTFDYIPRWIKKSSKIEGASQRIQQDTERFARLVESLGLQLVRALMTLIAFLPVLWGLSSGISIPILDQIIPGSLVYLAILFSIGGLVISWYVGIKLPGLEYNNQVVEAAFRKELVYGEDDRVNYCSMPELVKLFTGVRFNYQRLFNHYGYFDVWMNMYDQMMVIVPYIIVAPSLFTGAVTLGLVTQTSDAFRRVHQSLAIVLHNWTVITELRSIWLRLYEFERAIK